MNKLYTFITALLISATLFSQTPQSFKYQAVLRDTRGNVKSNTSTSIIISILQGSATGAAVYTETHSATTDGYGLINLEIGKGTATAGTFSGINWGTSTYFVKVTVDGVEMGTSQLLSVPYALYAKAVGSYTETDPVFAAWNKTTGISIPASQVSDFQTSVTNNAAVLLNTAKNSYPTAEQTKLSGIEAGAQVNVKPDWSAASGNVAEILNKPSLFNGDYNLLSNLPTLSIANWNTTYGWGNHTGLYRPVAWVPAWTDVTGKPTFASVATTGSYNDLSNTPTIPTQYTDAMADSRVVAGITGKVDIVTGKGLSTNDYTTTEKSKLAGIADGAEVNVQADWSQETNTFDDYIKNKPTLSIANWNTAYGWGNHALAGYITSADATTALALKVDKDGTKVLSTNDYTTIEKSKLAGIADGAEVNVQADWNQATNTADDYIKNKPTILNSQWTTTGSGVYYNTGNVGIGTPTPTNHLEVHSPLITTPTQFGLYNDYSGKNTSGSDYEISTIKLGTSLFHTSISTKIPNSHFGDETRLDFSTPAASNDNTQAIRMSIMPQTGNVGIGTTTPSSKLHVESNVSNHYAAVIRNYNNTSSGYGLQVVAGSTTASYGAYLIDFFDATGATRLGSITQSGSNTVLYNTSSDRRLKNNIVNTHFGINDLMKIQVRDYVYKADVSKTLTTGFIAQELYDIFPNAVTKPAKEEDMWSMDYGKVTPLLVKAIQEQQATIEAQQKQIDELKAQNTALAGELKAEIEAIKKAINGTNLVQK